MPTSLQSALVGLGLAAMVAMPALADGLKDEIAPTGRLRVAIAISPLAHWRSIDIPATVTGSPARSAAVRPMVVCTPC